ncbi:sulfoacetaldehyde dehydrogenase [Roseovarius lutimaris]|uniref:Sulfoacetaldehyde dehydrogenase n=1 Tax=Roseovarius lutimaris TaxID=1005928 RepID=A0A1I5CJG1_9RHOB|nr:aldehyde dehydrogenase family protein [Roseovarius lutimaris]SFN86791.1 sulfoacetaldehyde dehydrogenase [Roseovarius lutimaris]
MSAQPDTSKVVAALVERARAAMVTYDNTNQDRVDDAVTALAWSIYQPGNARDLAEMAVEDTGLGNVDSKVIKNTRKTFGTLRDLMRVRSVGVIDENPARGMVKYGKPVGVVAAVCPSTNPSATAVNKAMMALKGGNAVIIAPSPAGAKTTARTVELMRAELDRAGHPEDLVQILPLPVSKELTTELISRADLAVVTGSQNNVKRAMQSGTVAIGVGAGNVPVIIDESADLSAAARMIQQSKCFDNATSCSSENSVVILDSIYDAAIAALEDAGAWRCTADQRDQVRAQLWQNGVLNRAVIAKDPSVLAHVFDLPEAAKRARFFLVEEDSVDGAHSFADEKLSLVLTVYRALDWEHAKHIVHDVLEVCGKGHSVGIHTQDASHARDLAATSDVVRVLVNQPHTLGNGGSFENALPFTLSMGCGTWAGNTIDENLNWRHFVNITHLVTTIAEDKPDESDLFGQYWARHGK